MTATATNRDPRVGLLRRYGTNPSGFLALNAGNTYFTEPGIDGFVAYQESGKWWIQFGGPVAAEDKRKDLLSAFFARARQQRRRVIAVQLLREDAELQMGLGYRVNQFGMSFSMSLKSYTLRGQAFVKTRNMISRGYRDGLSVGELGVDVGSADIPDADRQLDEIDASWLRNKGRFTKEIQFFIGERTGEFQPMRRTFITHRDGQVLSYVSYSPVLGQRSGWMYDLTRRRPENTRGAIEMTFAFAAGRMREEQLDGWLHLGLTPFCGLDPGHELPSYHHGAAKVIKLLADHGQHLYPAATQLAFKRKWRPELETPEYLAFAGRLRPSAIWRLMKVANML